MARRTTFGKLQRERDKKEKQAAKRERRLSSPSEDEVTDAADETPRLDAAGEQEVLAQLADLHARHADGQLSLDDFETQRDRLIERLNVT